MPLAFAAASRGVSCAVALDFSKSVREMDDAFPPLKPLLLELKSLCPWNALAIPTTAPNWNPAICCLDQLLSILQNRSDRQYIGAPSVLIRELQTERDKLMKKAIHK
jgi:hypothetical protein